MARTVDPLDPSDLTREKHHNPASQRPSTRRSAPAKTGAESRAAHMQPGGKRTDLYRPEDVSGYSPALRGAILSLANLGLAGKPNKSKGKK